MYKILKLDPILQNYKQDIELRMENFTSKKRELLGTKRSLVKFAEGYKYFGFHKTKNGWVYREWAPAAEAMFLCGDFNNWDTYSCPLKRLENGVFEVHLEGEKTLSQGQKVQAIVIHNGQTLRRIPTYATRVVQDTQNYLWCAEIEDTLGSFKWTDEGFTPAKTPLIYECHIGMAQDKYGIGSYEEFRQNTLPRIKKLGYNTIQIMAVMEHPYYASFGYQVSNFFAASSRYGRSEELKRLINEAHSMGITVLLDVVHSHAVNNTNEGLCKFDGTEYQFFHQGSRGNHSAWGTKLFNYNKNEVLHFLLSNLKYWMEVFHFDGFRFDGVTSMLYHDHGLGSAFTNYDMYFSMNTDTEAVTYLQLANELVHKINPNAITVAEDMSGMPGMCIPIKDGGIGFDYRLSMGVPDLWIKMLREQSDWDWHLGTLWYELTTRRPYEKNIGYVESHDQALVGDKTVMFRLCDAEMYTGMKKFAGNITVDRGIALHKMIRLITSSLAGEGYLNFMGNEFGHPEWIDFPREQNGWSYHYCRRQWHLVDDEELRFGELNNFDMAMIRLLREENIFSSSPDCRYIHEDDKIIIYTKGDLVFAFNFNPERSFEGYFIDVGKVGKYKVILSTDCSEFGGQSRIDTDYLYESKATPSGKIGFSLYLPSRCAAVLKKV